MDAFEAAKAKYEKKQAQNSRYAENAVNTIIAAQATVKSRKATPTIRVIVGGYDFTFTVPGLFGNLPGAASTEAGMREIVQQALESKFGKRIECQPS